MKKQTKEDLIKNCGHLPVQTRGPDGALVVLHDGRCNYYKDCDWCNSIEGKKRHRKYEQVLRNTDNVFVSYVNQEDKSRLGKKIRREKVNALCVPQPDGRFLFVANADPCHKDIAFELIDKHTVLLELNNHHNLFPVGWRSTFGEWSLSESTQEQNSPDEITYQDMVCYFSPVTEEAKGNYSKLDFLRGAAMVWDGGEVTLDNIQHCADVNTSAFIESAHMSGWVLVPEKTKIIHRSITAEQLKDWKVINISLDKAAITYPNASKEAIAAGYPELVQIMDANTGIKNWRLWLIEYRKEKAEKRAAFKKNTTFEEEGIYIQ